jgi:hypothetical protein
MGLPSRDHHVRPAEILAHEQQLLAQAHGQSVAEEVAVVQAGGVPSFAELEPGVTRASELIHRYRNDLERELPHQCIQLEIALLAQSADENLAGLENGGGGHPPGRRREDGLLVYRLPMRHLTIVDN